MRNNVNIFLTTYNYIQFAFKYVGLWIRACTLRRRRENVVPVKLRFPLAKNALHSPTSIYLHSITGNIWFSYDVIGQTTRISKVWMYTWKADKITTFTLHATVFYSNQVMVDLSTFSPVTLCLFYCSIYNQQRLIHVHNVCTCTCIRCTCTYMHIHACTCTCVLGLVFNIFAGLITVTFSFMLSLFIRMWCFMVEVIWLLCMCDIRPSQLNSLSTCSFVGKSIF